MGAFQKPASKQWAHPDVFRAIWSWSPHVMTFGMIGPKGRFAQDGPRLDNRILARFAKPARSRLGMLLQLRCSSGDPPLSQLHELLFHLSQPVLGGLGGSPVHN